MTGICYFCQRTGMSSLGKIVRREVYQPYTKFNVSQVYQTLYQIVQGEVYQP